jgi:hypothetical protein
MAGKIAQDGAGLSEDATNHAVSLSPTSWRRVLVSIQVQGPVKHYGTAIYLAIWVMFNGPVQSIEKSARPNMT